MFDVLVVMMLLAIVSGFLMLWKIPEAVYKGAKASDGKTVSVIIPARNEARNLPLLLTSLQNQHVQPAEVIVVDDHSEDATAQIAQAYGARLMQSAPDSQGDWTGKAAACWQGAQAAKGDWLLFMDADTRFEQNDSLARLLTTYAAGGATGILSFQPFHEIVKVYENLSVVFNVVLMAGMNVFTPLGTRLKTAGAFGPCIIVDRAEYFLTNGHKAVANAILDDLALGDNFSANGFPVRCYSGRGMISFRMYPEGIQQLIEGWTKGFGTAVQSTHPGVTMLISVWLSGAFITVGTLLRSLSLGQVSEAVMAAGFCLGYMLQLYWQARRLGSFHVLVILFYPLLFLFFIGLFLRSLFYTNILHKVKWRGRDIQV